MTKHFSGDQVFNSVEPELSKPPPSECPRCGSTNTKFCYYNNYNKSQPRHSCKSCKRHWTKGGTLRNIPAARRRRNNRPRTTTAAPAPPPRQQEHLRYADDDMSNILYQALARSSSPSAAVDNSMPQGTILESNGATFIAQNQNQNTGLFTFSFNPTSNYQYSSGSGNNIFHFAEETTSAAPPWTAVNPSTAAADLWNWNESDFLDAVADYKPIFEENYYLC